MSKIKIKYRLIILTISALYITAIISFIGHRNIDKLSNQTSHNYAYNTLPLRYVGQAQGAYNNLKVLLFDLILDEVVAPDLLAEADESLRLYKASITAFENIINDPKNTYYNQDDINMVHALYNTLPALEDAYDEIIDYIQRAQAEKAFYVLRNDIRVLSDEIIVPYLDALSEDTIEMAMSAEAKAQGIARYSKSFIWILFGCSFVFLAAFAYFIARSITKPIDEIVQVAQEIAKGNLEVNIRYEGKGEVGILADRFRMMAHSFRALIAALSTMATIHDGGDYEYRIDTSCFQGAYKEVADSVNNMMHDYIALLKNIRDCLAAYGDGDFSANIPQLPGKKKEMNDAVQGLRDALNSVSGSANELITAAAAGDLQKRIDAGVFGGEWAVLVEQLNLLMNTIAEPIDEAASALGKMAEGDLSVQMQGSYDGDFATIKKALNTTTSIISTYIEDINEVLGSISNNDLTGGISKEYVGDFISIKESINRIIIQLRKMISNIADASLQVDDGAREISDSSLRLAEGSTEQSNTIHEFSTAMEDMNQKLQLSAEQTDKANQLTLDVRERGAAGSAAMVKMLEAMESIKASSKNISQVVQVISTIAFQTNILSLNASVEAARAGEHGKGFAVVANEVRNLAAKSQSAVEETTNLIEDSIQKVRIGFELAKSTAGELENIVDGVTVVSDIVMEMNHQSKLLSKELEQMSSHIFQISDVITQNSANSEATASASEQLSSQAELLNGLVNSFHYKKDQ